MLKISMPTTTGISLCRLNIKKESLQKIFYISVLKSHLYTGQTEVFLPERVIYHLNDFHSCLIYELGKKQPGRQNCGVQCLNCQGAKVTLSIIFAHG